MADEIKVKPTPVQRNTLDVAIELTQMYFSTHGIGNIEEIQNAFLKFYSVAEFADRNTYKQMLHYLPEDLKDK